MFPSRGLSADTRASHLWRKPAGTGQLLPCPACPEALVGVVVVTGQGPCSQTPEPHLLSVFSLVALLHGPSFRIDVLPCGPSEEAAVLLLLAAAPLQREPHRGCVREPLGAAVFLVGGEETSVQRPARGKAPPSSPRLCCPGAACSWGMLWADPLRAPLLCPDSRLPPRGSVFPPLTSWLRPAWCLAGHHPVRGAGVVGSLAFTALPWLNSPSDGLV